MTITGGVSCVMAVWNGERHVRAAIDSVLRQSRPPDEMVVVDDGSTDGTLHILDEFGGAVRIVRMGHGGAARAINEGIAASTGEFVTFCDADDLLTPDSIAARLTVLEHDHDLDAVFGCVEQFVSPEVPTELAGRFRFTTRPVAAPLLGAMLTRRSAFEHHGPIDEGRTAGYSVAWFARARDAGLRHTFIDDVVLRRRLHGTNMSRSTGRQGNRDLLDVVREHRRRRSGQGS